MPVIPDSERLRQEDQECSKPDWTIVVSLRSASATGDHVSEK